MTTPIAQPKPAGPLPPGSNPQLEAEIAANIERQQVEDAAGRRAATCAMPGPTAEVFTLPESIAVGKYRFRAFTDGDFETLSMLGHPLHQMMTESQDGKPPSATGFTPRGRPMWELCLILTTEPDEVDKLMESPGALSKAARKEFSRYQMGALAEFSKAIVKQLTRYWSMVQGYTNSGEGQEGEQSSPPAPSGAA